VAGERIRIRVEDTEEALDRLVLARAPDASSQERQGDSALQAGWGTRLAPSDLNRAHVTDAIVDCCFRQRIRFTAR
jgi:hypothetical protein